MIEISRSGYDAVRLMITSEPPGFLIALSALENVAGRVFVDDASKPNCAFLLSPTGWHSALGNFDAQTAAEASRLFLSHDALVYLKEYNCHTSRLAVVGRSFEISNPEQIPIRCREMLILSAHPHDYTDELTDPRIIDLDLDSYHQAARFTPMLSKFWPDPNALVGKHMAKVFIEDGETKGICYSCFHSGDIHEPHITVGEKHRGRGIGKLLAVNYTNGIRKQGQRLFWGHYPENIGSCRLAAAAGFKAYGRVNVLQYFRSGI